MHVENEYKRLQATGKKPLIKTAIKSTLVNDFSYIVYKVHCHTHTRSLCTLTPGDEIYTRHSERELCFSKNI